MTNKILKTQTNKLQIYSKCFLAKSIAISLDILIESHFVFRAVTVSPYACFTSRVPNAYNSSYLCNITFKFPLALIK